MIVPVSGEDQPDPRVESVAKAILYGLPEWVGNGVELAEITRQVLLTADAADRAAGIRRVTEQFTRQQVWGAWDDGYEAARNGRQKRNPHRAPVAAPVPVQEDRK